jgi:hypothetical protein
MKLLLYTCGLQLVTAAAVAPRGSGKAAYFLDNNPTGASIVALKISASDGSLSEPVRVSTGGKGLFGLTGGPPPAAAGAGKLIQSQLLVIPTNRE